MAKTEMTKSEKTPKEMAEAVLTPLDYQVNRNSKDSVFCHLFSDPKYTGTLCCAPSGR